MAARQAEPRPERPRERSEQGREAGGGAPAEPRPERPRERSEQERDTGGARPKGTGILKIRDDLDDARLTKAAQAGDRRALEDLLRRHQGQIHAICRRLAGNDADGQDATQEALIAIVRGLPRFHGKAKFSTWAYRVATNAALDELRRRSRRPVPVEAEDRPATASAGDDPASVAVRLDLDAALAQLPEEFRAPVVLRDVAGCDYAEIGQILRIPPGTVRSRIARGRARLAEAMSANGGNRHYTPQRRNDEASEP